MKKQRSKVSGIVMLARLYCDLCGVSEEYLKPVPSPALPESSMQDEEAEKQGELHRGAAKASMRLLWLSRLSRPDLSFIILHRRKDG